VGPGFEFAEFVRLTDLDAADRPAAPPGIDADEFARHLAGRGR
jgi:hypothetical protein